ncbi:uncharacterized protein BDZ99DRAFT_563097 [Mytilinidion resinicola]|uniref:ER-bound oxygenase mpaB/mpaB'/Rubber oxygenase catalytic domain-containing protein n=1 Tax=Mytilinidion resinicola TaxID=574789 RepID=A0A6A6YND2_9PEZI|nr:uncharacterized protein BDZ99DRAFT_563097 [Mytilinidion resinicola]KAF2810251.1 hypothetical protein BDZ99DRAFT_563097 [Mytilinidion resinicola]
MACAFAPTGAPNTLNPHSLEVNEKSCPVNLNTKSIGTDSTEAITSTTEKPEHGPAIYGINHDNFHRDFLKPDFDPKEMRNIVSEAILLAGGGVAILLQIANPGVGAGVNEHSNFVYRPIDRLRTTMTFVYCMAFGTPEEKKTIINMVHRAHDPVKGDGYTAHDVELQLWVAATLYAAGVDIYEKTYGKLNYATSKAVYNQYAMLASSLRVPPEMCSKTQKDFWEYWDRSLTSFTISAHAKNVANDLLFNNRGLLWVRANLPLVRLFTAEWLPPNLRDAYGLKTSTSRRALYKVYMVMIKTGYPIMPRFIRHFPRNYYMKDMRKRIKGMDHIIGPDMV